MSPFELRSLRKFLKVSKERMAELLGVRTELEISDFEQGNTSIPEPVSRLATYMQQGQSMGDDMDKYLPKFLICSDLEGKLEYEYVFHTRYPRFIAMVTDFPINNTVHTSIPEPEFLCVSMWIDEPVDHNEGQRVVDEAGAHFLQYSNESMKKA